MSGGRHVFCDGPTPALVACVGGRWADGLVIVLGYYRSLTWSPHVPVRIFDFEIWEGGGWIGVGCSAGCGGRRWIWFCIGEHPFSVGTLFGLPLNCCIVLGSLSFLLGDVHELVNGIRCHIWW